MEKINWLDSEEYRATTLPDYIGSDHGRLQVHGLGAGASYVACIPNPYSKPFHSWPEGITWPTISSY